MIDAMVTRTLLEDSIRRLDQLNAFMCDVIDRELYRREKLYNESGHKLLVFKPRYNAGYKDYK